MAPLILHDMAVNIEGLPHRIGRRIARSVQVWNSLGWPLRKDDLIVDWRKVGESIRPLYFADRRRVRSVADHRIETRFQDNGNFLNDC
jgi:hypothetical protein